MQNLLRRLELLKNLILLEEEPLIASQAIHLISYSREYPLIARLLAALKLQRYSQAQQLISEFLQQQHGLVCVEDIELAALRLECQALEQRLQSLIEQQAEQHAKLDEYQLLHHKMLSPLLEQILALRQQLAADNLLLAQMPLRLKQAELARQQRELEQQLHDLNAANARATASEQAQFEEARDDYQHYRSQQQDEGSRLAGLDALSQEELAELKRLYRRACKLAHPDLVDPAQREQAHQMMVAINTAKDAGDLNTIQQLLAQLEAGHWQLLAGTATTVATLRQRISELNQQIGELQAAMAEQQSDDALAAVLHSDDLDQLIANQHRELEELCAELAAQQTSLAAELTHYHAQLAALAEPAQGAVDEQA